MAADKLQYAIGNSASTTSSSSISNSDTTLPITSDTNFAAKSGEGLVLIDEGESSEELAYSTGKTGATLAIPLANRGLEGGSAQAHVSGATVKGILTAGMWNNVIDALTAVVLKTTGLIDTTKVVDLTTAQTLTTKTLTTPVIASFYQDAGKTKLMTTPNTASDTLAAIAATQTLTNKTYIQKETTYTPAASGTAAIDLTTGNLHKITMPAGNISITVDNEVNGQCFLVEITQDSGGSRLVSSWFSTIKWAGGSAPTLTTTASKRDVFGFRVTGTDTYDGFIVGLNL